MQAELLYTQANKGAKKKRDLQIAVLALKLLPLKTKSELLYSFCVQSKTEIFPEPTIYVRLCGMWEAHLSRLTLCGHMRAFHLHYTADVEVDAGSRETSYLQPEV